MALTQFPAPQLGAGAGHVQTPRLPELKCLGNLIPLGKDQQNTHVFGAPP